MSATSARAARRERQAAAVLGTDRVHRQRGESAPDVKPVTLPSGHILQAEVKSRAKLPRVARLAVEQAHGYAPGALPVAVVFEKGSRDGIASMRLADFARLVGLDVAALPEPTPLRRRRRPAPACQLSLLGDT